MILVLFVESILKNDFDIAFEAFQGALSIGASQRKSVSTDINLESFRNTLAMKPMPALVQEAGVAFVQVNITDLTKRLVYFHFGLVVLHVLFLLLLEFSGELLVLLHFADEV